MQTGFTIAANPICPYNASRARVQGFRIPSKRLLVRGQVADINSFILYLIVLVLYTSLTNSN